MHDRNFLDSICGVVFRSLAIDDLEFKSYQSRHRFSL
jgi:hypothetical protein